MKLIKYQHIKIYWHIMLLKKQTNWEPLADDRNRFIYLKNWEIKRIKYTAFPL